MNYKKDIIVLKLRPFLGNKKAIIGVSGGIDSAVSLALSVEAVGKENVIGVTLPYGEQSIEDSTALIKQLGVFHVNRDIKPAVDAICPELHDNKLTLGNIMARTRMVHLYAISNNVGGIVVGTTNRSEAEIGYYTKYGDGGVDVEPIADLWKREVYEVGKDLNIPESIMTKAPSANLWEGQTDEGEFGFTYDDLEKYFHSLQHGADPKLFIDPKAVDKIASMIIANDHKKHMPLAFKV